MRTISAGAWILLGALWLLNLPLRPLFDPDEGRYAEIPREMVASGNWVTPTLNGLKYFEKPPLQYWATATFYSLFGVHTWTARLWSTALAFLCIPLVFAFTRRIGHSMETAVIAAALLAVNPAFVLLGQVNLLDQGFTFFLTSALFSFVLAQRAVQPRQSKNWMLLTWAALALAVLSKGIVTLVLAGGTVLAYIAVTRDFGLLRRLRWGTGLPLFLLICLPWFWYVQQRNPEFFQFFFVREHLERYLTKIDDRVEPFWFFIPILFVTLLPIIGNWRSWRWQAIEAERQPGEFRVELFLALWCAVVVVLFSFSQSKLPAYVMPIMPALAVVLARVTQVNTAAFPRAKWLSIGFLLIVAVGVVGAAWRRHGFLSESAIAWALVAVIVCVGFLAIDRAQKTPAASQRWFALAAVSVTSYQLLALCYASAFPARSAAGIAAEFSGSMLTNTNLYSVGQFRHSLAFYLRRPLAVYDYRGELDFGMGQARMSATQQGREQFLERWLKERDAIAFMDPNVYAALSAAGMPGRVIARDERSIVVARS